MVRIAALSYLQNIALLLCLAGSLFHPLSARSATTDPGDIYKGALWLLQQADAARDEGKTDDAVEAYRSTLEIYESMARQFPRWERDLVRFRATYCREQLEALTGLAAPSPEATRQSTAVLAEAGALRKKGDRVAALSKLTKQIRQDPGNPNLAALLGIVLLEQGQAETCAILLRPWADGATPSVGHLMTLAGAELALGNWSDAKRRLDQAAKLDPNQAAIHYNFVQLYLTGDAADVESASAAYLKYLSVGGTQDSEIENRLKQ